MKKLLEAILKEAEQVDREVEGFRKTYGQPSDSIRVAVAVFFLTNPNVKGSHQERIEFLKKKGYSDEEIEQALQIALKESISEKVDLKKLLATGAIATALLATPYSKAQAGTTQRDLESLWGFLTDIVDVMSGTNPKYQQSSSGVVVTTTATPPQVVGDMLKTIQDYKEGVSMEEKLEAWLENNPSPTEEQIEEWAYENGYNVKDVKDTLYRWASEKIKGK